MVEPINREEKLNGGIILTDKNLLHKVGKIVQLGIKVKSPLKVGDTIMYYEHVGIPLNYEGKNYLLLSETNEIISKL